MVNAWIYLDEDQPSGAGYDSPNSSYQSLVINNVYQSVDMLFVCFFDTISDGSGYYTLEIGNAGTVHPGGLTTKQYLQKVITDSRKQKSDIKILATLNYNNNTLSRIFSQDPSKWVIEANTFAKNLCSYLVSNQMDGFDIDWEGDFSYSISTQQFAILFSAIRSAFNASTKYLYLTLSPASVGNLDATTVNNDFDFLNVQLYSGFTSPEEFLEAGILPAKLQYGAQFEQGVGIWQNANQVFKGYSAGFDYKNVHYPYNIVTQWRLNSGNYEYEQSQQILLYLLINTIQTSNFNDTGIISNAGNPPITKLIIRSGEIIDSIQATNTSSGGTVFNLLQHGGNGGGQSIITLDKGDVINKITGYKGVWFGWNCIAQITVTTRNGKTYGPFGNTNNVSSKTSFSYFAPSGQSIVSFSGITTRILEGDGTPSFIVTNLNVSYGNS